MSTMNRNLIAYHGVENLSRYKNIEYFNQIIIDFTFCLCLAKPDIRQIINVWVNPVIRTQQLVRTPEGVSLEGKKLTGYKWMISGDIEYRIDYETDGRIGNMCTAKTVQPFGGYISLPEKFNPNGNVNAIVSIEDIQTEQLDEKCTYNSVAMMLVADLG